MNIQSIKSFNFSDVLNNDKVKTQNNHPRFGVKFAQQPSCDTVSFKATVKNLESRTAGIRLSVARQIHQEVAPMQPKIEQFLNNLFGDLIITEKQPKNPVYKICSRTKSPLSIMEKSATRQWNTKKDVLEYATDLNAAKIVMSDNRKKVVEKVLSRLLKPISVGEIELLEIENKRPAITQTYKGKAKEMYDYASIEFLSKLMDEQNARWDKFVFKRDKFINHDMNDLTNINYPAIHFLFEFQHEKRPFELVIVGKNVNDYKDLDDKFFKILNNKNLDRCYDPLVEVVSRLLEPGNEEYLKAFNDYRRAVFIHQRKKPPYEYNKLCKLGEDKPTFLSLSNQILPSNFDMNNLYDLMLQCEAHKGKKIKISK